jgi:hypothetical protein
MVLPLMLPIKIGHHWAAVIWWGQKCGVTLGGYCLPAVDGCCAHIHRLTEFGNPIALQYALHLLGLQRVSKYSAYP